MTNSWKAQFRQNLWIGLLFYWDVFLTWNVVTTKLFLCKITLYFILYAGWFLIYSSKENLPEPMSQNKLNKLNTIKESHNSELTKEKPLRILVKNTAPTKIGIWKADANRVRQPSEINNPPPPLPFNCCHFSTLFYVFFIEFSK